MKLQSFYLMKFESKKLKDCKYKISMSFEDMLKNGYLVREGDSELLRAIRRMKGIKFSQSEFDKLLLEEKKLKRKRNSEENRIKLIETRSKINDLLFVPELLIIKFDNVSHYKKIFQLGGIKINDKNYVRLLSSAGMARKSEVMFCDDAWVDRLQEFLNVSRDESYKINPNKYNAYVALATSASYKVTTPRFCVVPDREELRTIDVDFLIEQPVGIDPLVEERTIQNPTNLFDGEGLVSPRMMSVWQKDLELDYLPSAVIFRGAWLKGLLVTFDFHELARMNNIEKLLDIYGNEHKVSELDVILTQSQFKLSGAYKDLEDYLEKCKQHNYGWSITRPSPAKDKDTLQMTYQYLQSMKIDTQEKIEFVCKDTIDWLNGLHGNNWNDTVLFLNGAENRFEDIDKKWFDNLDTVNKLLLLDKRILGYEYIRKYVQKMIQKKIKESYIGVVNVPGNYQFVISDPYALCQHVLGLSVTGLLKDKESYSQYWKNSESVMAFRSPLTWRSEVNLLQLVRSDELNYWYKYLYSGIVFNIYGDDALRMSSMDHDGDIIGTTNKFNDSFIYDEYRRIPIYERKTADKKFINLDDLWQDDIRTFGSKIGLVTNFGTSVYAMLHGANESVSKILIKRMIHLNGAQNMSIDSAKGIKVFPFPNWYSQYNKPDEEDDTETISRKELYNNVLIRNRPYFMKYVYNHYRIEYDKFLDMAEKYFHATFGKSVQEIKNNPQTEHEIRMCEIYDRQVPLLDNDSTMNAICKYMETQVKKIRSKGFEKEFFINNILKIEYDSDLHEKMKSLYKDYKGTTRKSGEDDWEVRAKRIREKANKITSYNRELVYYSMLVDESFMFRIFGEDLAEILLEYYCDWIEYPCLSDNGNLEYLNRKYEVKTINVS